MSSEESTPELKTYHGNCHCGAFKFHINIPELTTVFACNCSICFRKNYLWVFPSPGNYIIDKGDENTLTDYEFGPKTMAHKFCSTCGVGVQGKRHNAPPGRDIGINVRTLQDIDIWSLKLQKFDGAAISPPYKSHPFTGTLPTPPSTFKNPKIYTGGCHCGAVTVALVTDGPYPTNSETVLECDCSICSRNGSIRSYPAPEQFSVSDPSSALVSYTFGRRFADHKFCRHCGVAIYIEKRRDTLPQSVYDSWDEAARHRWDRQVPVNLRVFEGIDWDAILEGEPGEIVDSKLTGNKDGLIRLRGSEFGTKYVVPA